MPLRRVSSLLRATAVLAVVFPVASLAAACQGSSPAVSAADAGEAGADAPDDTTLLDEPECNPCLEVCPCTPGDSFFNTGQCQWEFCVGGSWGGMSCLGLGCQEGGDDGPGDDQTDGARDGGTAEGKDAGSEAGNDAGGEAGTGGGTDGAADAASDAALD